MAVFSALSTIFAFLEFYVDVGLKRCTTVCTPVPHTSTIFVCKCSSPLGKEAMWRGAILTLVCRVAFQL